jgi:hypothetical protein
MAFPTWNLSTGLLATDGVAMLSLKSDARGAERAVRGGSERSSRQWLGPFGTWECSVFDDRTVQHGLLDVRVPHVGRPLHCCSLEGLDGVWDGQESIVGDPATLKVRRLEVPHVEGRVLLAH